MPLDRRDDEHLRVLHPEAERHCLEQEGLSRAGCAINTAVRVRVFVAVEDVEDSDRAVVLVQSEKDAALIVDFVG